jgi:elongation factor P
MARYSTNEFKCGMKIILNNNPCSIISHEFHKPGKGQAVMRVKLRNLHNGNVVEKTFKTGESVEAADVQETTLQYLYADTDNWCFMSTDESCDQFFIGKSALGDTLDWLKEEFQYQVTFWNNEPISVMPPNIVELQVVETPPGVKGDTASGGNKPAVLETGVSITVPLFINEGDVVKVNTQMKSYLGRVKQ